MKQLTLAVLLAILLVLAACTVVDEQPPINDTNATEPYETAELAQAQSWVQNAPTYAYDGMNLTLVEYFVQESYPEQHVITFNFTSRQAGYGDRSDEMTAQVLTDHTIRVTIIEQEVVSAVIDGTWDEINQQEIQTSNNQTPPTTPSGQVTMTFQPMQCDEYAWDEWYANNEQQYVTEPTTEQLVTDYYSQEHGIELSVQRVDMPSDQAVCQACSICRETYHLEATVSEADTSALEADNWQ